MPHGDKLLTRGKHPVPVVPRVFPQSFVVAVAPGRLWPYRHDCQVQGGVTIFSRRGIGTGRELKGTGSDKVRPGHWGRVERLTQHAIWGPDRGSEAVASALM
jgi:hypothetical protein